MDIGVYMLHPFEIGISKKILDNKESANYLSITVFTRKIHLSLVCSLK